jgi:squalene-hopene/tetraprenyl-beta-curcumene cyclase
MPVEIMLLPRWFPFHLDKISYWSRTFLVPVLVLMALQPRARNPHGITVRELFVEPPESVRDWIAPPTPSLVSRAFAICDWLVRRIEPFFRRSDGGVRSKRPLASSPSVSMARTVSGAFSRRWPTP